MAEKVLEPLPETVDRAYIDTLLEKCVIPPVVHADIFAEKIRAITGDIVAERRAQDTTPFLEVPPYTVGDLRFVIHSALVAASGHADCEPRDSGEPVFAEHLHGAAQAAVTIFGRTKPTLIGAEYLHDLIEDTKIKSFPDFERAWKATFADRYDPFIRQSLADRKRTWNIMVGLTQIVAPPKVTDLEAKQFVQGGTLRGLLQKILVLGFDVLYAKGGDRFHNMSTIWSKKEEEGDAGDLSSKVPDARKKRKANETYEIYVPFFAILGAQQFVRKAVSMCAEVLNPSLLEAFTAERDRRIDAFLHRKIEPYYPEVRDDFDLRHRIEIKTFVSEMFQGSAVESDIVSCEVVPAELGDFVMQDPKPLEQKTMADLPITTRTPLFDIVVILKPGSDKAAVVNVIKKKLLKQGETYEETQSDPNALVQGGITLTIHSRSYGPKKKRNHGFGVINFRVNDSVSEARAKRGEIPFADNRGIAKSDAVARYVRQAIQKIVDETSGEMLDDNKRVLPLMKELLLKPRVTVYTRDHDPITLPRGATPLDVANEIHERLLAALQGVLHHVSQGSAVAVSPFDEVADGMVLEILKEVPPGVNPVELDRAALHFCATEDAKRTLIKNVLEKMVVGSELVAMPREVQIIRGRTYLGKIASIFGIPFDDALAVLEKRLIPTIRAEEKRDTFRRWTERDKERKERGKIKKENLIGDSVKPREHLALGKKKKKPLILRRPIFMLKNGIRKVKKALPSLYGVLQSPSPLRRLNKVRRAGRIQRMAHANEALGRVWRGEVDELVALEKARFSSKKSWNIRLELPDTEGILDKFTGEFKREQINVNRIVQIPGPPGGTHVLHFDIEDRRGNHSTREMMKVLLRLSYKYGHRLTVQSGNPIRRGLGMWGDYFRMMVVRALTKHLQ